MSRSTVVDLHVGWGGFTKGVEDRVPWWCGPLHRTRFVHTVEPPGLLPWITPMVRSLVHIDDWAAPLRGRGVESVYVNLAFEDEPHLGYRGVGGEAVHYHLAIPDDVATERDLTWVARWLLDATLGALTEIGDRLGLGTLALRSAPSTDVPHADTVLRHPGGIAAVFDDEPVEPGAALVLWPRKNAGRAPLIAGFAHLPRARHDVGTCMAFGLLPRPADLPDPAAPPALTYDFLDLAYPVRVDEIAAGPQCQVLACQPVAPDGSVAEARRRLWAAAGVLTAAMPIAPRVLGRDGQVLWMSFDWVRRHPASKPGPQRSADTQAGLRHPASRPGPRRRAITEARPGHYPEVDHTVGAPPELVAIDPDDHHAEHVGLTADGRQYFLTAPFLIAARIEERRDFIACYLFDRGGRLVEDRIRELGPCGCDTRAEADAVLDELLAPLGPTTRARIVVRPFVLDRFGLRFGLIPRWSFDSWEVVVEPGDYMAFFEPWDSGTYDT